MMIQNLHIDKRTRPNAAMQLVGAMELASRWCHRYTFFLPVIIKVEG